MVLRSKRVAIGAAMVVLVGGLTFLLAYWLPRIRMSCTVTQTFGEARPLDRAFEALLKGAPLREIQAEVEASGKGIDEHTDGGVSLLAQSVLERRYDVAEWLLRQGANPDGVDPDSAPLGFAVWQEDARMVRLLLDHGADPELVTGSDLTVLRRPVINGNQEIVQMLEEAAASRKSAKNINHAGSTGDSEGPAPISP
jgi:ankyrin repeat protein